MKLPASVSYSIRRLALFVATLAFLVLVLQDVSFLLVLVIATVVSGFLSYFLLAGPREEMAQSFEKKVKGLNQRIDAKAKAEDAALDAAEAEAARRKVQPKGASGNSGESGEDATGGR